MLSSSSASSSSLSLSLSEFSLLSVSLSLQSRLLPPVCDTMEEAEVKLLARVSVNYLFLAQFEAFRASLSNLRQHDPGLSSAILESVVEKGGRLDGISWSPSLSSPSHLAWLSLGELLDNNRDSHPLPPFFSPDGEGADAARDEVELLFLLETLIRDGSPSSPALSQRLDMASFRSSSRSSSISSTRVPSTLETQVGEKSEIPSPSSSSSSQQRSEMASSRRSRRVPLMAETLTEEKREIPSSSLQQSDMPPSRRSRRVSSMADTVTGDKSEIPSPSLQQSDTTSSRSRKVPSAVKTPTRDGEENPWPPLPQQQQLDDTSSGSRQVLPMDETLIREKALPQKSEKSSSRRRFPSIAEISSLPSSSQQSDLVYSRGRRVPSMPKALIGGKPEISSPPPSQQSDDVSERKVLSIAETLIGDKSDISLDNTKEEDEEEYKEEEGEEEDEARMYETGRKFLERVSDVCYQSFKLSIERARHPPGSELDNEKNKGNGDSTSQSSGEQTLANACREIISTLPIQRRFLQKLSLCQPQLLNAICWNFSRQKTRAASNTSGSSVAERAKMDLLSALQSEVQIAHCKTIVESFPRNGLDSAYYLQFLHDNFTVSDSQYSEVVNTIVKQFMFNNDLLMQNETQTLMLDVYQQAIASGNTSLLSLIEGTQDQFLREKADVYRASNEFILPPPLQQLHEYLEVLRTTGGVNAPATEELVASSCRRQLYQYTRAIGTHMLEVIMEAALSAVKICNLQIAADVLSLFPRLRPLVAAIGWDLLAGNTSARRTMMELLWFNKSMETSANQKHGDETSCIEHLCDQLCYRLELAYFAARANSGLSWDAQDHQLFLLSKRDGRTGKSKEDGEPADLFVANLVLERLAMHSPVRVLFDVVPDMKLKHALLLVKMQPVGSLMANMQREQDLELLHLHYGIQAAVLALSVMESSTENNNSGKSKSIVAALLQELKEHFSEVSNPARCLWLMGIVIALLHMDDFLSQQEPSVLEAKLESMVTADVMSDDDEILTPVNCVGKILGILRQHLPASGFDLEEKMAKGQRGPGRHGREAWEHKATVICQFIDDWEWRLSVLRRLSPSPKRHWQWKEALAVLRAAPSTLLNLCVQKAQYDLGEEAVHRFALPPEDEVALQLAEWVDGTVARASADDAVSRVVEGASRNTEVFDFDAFRPPLAPLSSVLLYLDAAATSAKSAEMSKQLLERARSVLSEISSGAIQRQGITHVEQIQEASIIFISKRVLSCLQDMLDQRRALQRLLSGADLVNAGLESLRQSPRQRALAIFQQTIEDAYDGKRQFLSGKLHNLVKALADEDTDEGSMKLASAHPDKRAMLPSEHGFLLGYGLRVPLKNIPTSNNVAFGGDQSSETSFHSLKGSGKRFFGSLISKPFAYLSAFILYIATIGDIVDGVDTTHDFNFFTLIYERPSDLLTRLVFERGSADAAGKIAEIMGADLVHQVISACVPPVYPPYSSGGWASVPLLQSHRLQHSGIPLDSNKSAGSSEKEAGLYALRIDVVKHLATLSPVRALLACVFGTSTYSRSSRSLDVAVDGKLSSVAFQKLENDRAFYEFALEHSDRFPTLNRWIQMQVNLKRLSDFPLSSRRSIEMDSMKEAEKRLLLKRVHEPESETDSEEDDSILSGKAHARDSVDMREREPKAAAGVSSEPRTMELSNSHSLLYDWENENIYEEAVQRLMEEGNLVDALALADRYLRGGAPDELLQMLIEKGDDAASRFGQWHGYASHHNTWNISWQYCLRLRDKRLATTLAMKYLRNWDLDSAIDVLTMCSCHLSPNDSLYEEVVRVKGSLQQYSRILRADGRFSSWQEVESLCERDPEDLALRLAGRGAVTAALEVCEKYGLREELKRELQSRQLVKLLTTDPINGGGPAEALRFLASSCSPEEALPIAMAAMEELPTLPSKQLLVHFFLKRRVGTLTEDELALLNKLSLGLQMLGSLPLPWQQRCSALHQHPQLILETLLMWKQIQAASQLLQSFPTLRDYNLIFVYATKAINVGSYTYYERRSTQSSMIRKGSSRFYPATRSNNNNIIPSGQREARRAFSWTSRDSGNKITPKELTRKRKNTLLPPSQKAAWEAMSGIHEERMHGYSQDGMERIAQVTMTDGWVLTGDPSKDNSVRTAHRYESAPSFTLFKALLGLCSSETVAAKATLELCINQMKHVLSSQQLPLSASSESIERTFHATEVYVQALLHAKTQLRKLSGIQDVSERVEDGSSGVESTHANEKLSNIDNMPVEDFSVLLSEADTWLSRAELLQSLLGLGVIASLDDVSSTESAERLRDRLIERELFSMGVYACTKCKIDAFPVWIAWAGSLIQMDHFSQARMKLKQAIRLYQGDPSVVIRDIISTMESGPAVDVSSVRSLYDHMAKSASTILDDSLSADAYLNVLYMPSSLNKSERSRRSSEDSADNFAAFSAQANGEDGLKSNLDPVQYEECTYYLREYARQDLMAFMFKHGRYADACTLFFPPKTVPTPPQPSPLMANQPPSSSPQRSDPLATDYGSVEDLCEFCVTYGAMPVLERVIATRGLSSNNQDPLISQHTTAALTRICAYCENHKHFNHLYRFQCLRKDHVAAGLCCIQLFLNSSNQEQAIRHLERAKKHFDEGVMARQQVTDKSVPKAARGKSPSERFTEEELAKFATRIVIQTDVVRCFSDADGAPWKHSLFGNPNDADTHKRRGEVAEALAERNFDLAFQVIFQFGLTAVDIYAAVAASLAERRKNHQLSELLKNIKSTITNEDLDQVIIAAIMVFVNKHKERPDRLIDQLTSDHKKVLACVVCGRLKSAFQIASKSGSVSDVQYVAHQARQAGSSAVEDMCKQWIARHA